MKQEIGPKLEDAIMLIVNAELKKREMNLVHSIDPFNEHGKWFDRKVLASSVHDNIWADSISIKSKFFRDWLEDTNSFWVGYKGHNSWIHGTALRGIPKNSRMRGDFVQEYTDPVLFEKLEAHYLVRKEHEETSQATRLAVQAILKKYKYLNDAVADYPMLDAYVPQYAKDRMAAVEPAKRKAAKRVDENVDLSDIKADMLAAVSVGNKLMGSAS